MHSKVCAQSGQKVHSWEQIVASAWGARAVHAADLEGDGDVDVLSGTQRNHDIVWYVNEANYTDSDGDGMRDELDCAPNNA